MDIEKEENKLNALLCGKVVEKIFRYKKTEVCIQFTDGTRFFINRTDDKLEFSIT